MVSKFSLFLASLLYPHIFPHRKQQLIELLEEIAEDVPINPCCEDILEVWLEEFGASGLLLGNVALFFFGLVLMIVVDISLRRWNSTAVCIAVGSFSALYCLFKFKTRKALTNILIFLFCLYWLASGFWWSIAFLFLVYFTNMGVRYAQGGSLC